MERTDLPIDSRFDRRTQGRIATLHATLEEQRRDLIAAVADATVEALEWQAAPGTNTVGMLLAHVAITEAFWLRSAPAGQAPADVMGRRVEEVLHVAPDADGMPLVPGEGHPATLAGWTPTRYAALLGLVAAKASYDTLADWNDETLGETTVLEEHGRSYAITRRWMLYHVVEHLAQHVGQVRLLLAMHARAAAEGGDEEDEDA